MRHDLKTDCFELSISSDIPSYCIERNSIVRTKMLTAVWQLAKQKETVYVLDAGCGNARMWVGLLQALPNVHYYGVEPATGLVKTAQDNLPSQNTHIVAGTAENVSTYFPDVKFDIIISRAVLEHVYYRHDYLESLKEVLATTGKIYLTWGTQHFKGGLKDHSYNIISQLLAAIGNHRYYTRNVSHAWFERTIEKLKFHIDKKAGYSLLANKKMHKYVSDTQQSQQALLLWLALEENYNNHALIDDFYLHMDEMYYELTHG